ncbi:MAG: IS256 family transposase, variant Zn-binding type, partial [Pyrinomonadaceae bacterium]
YTEGKQTYEQLAQRHGCSVRTIQRRLDRVEVKAAGTDKGSKLEKVVIVTDTTYFGRDFGVLLIFDAHRARMLHREFVKYETNELYERCVNTLKEQGYEIAAIVCDGRKGLFHLFGNTPIQMCQFHQTAIITRYLTRKPKILASQELRSLARTLSKTDKQTFSDGLGRWFERWQEFLNERTTNPITGKTRHTHRRLRSAYRSLKTNLPWLFTFDDLPDLRIPNTTNLLEGIFADLKNKLRCHNGLSKQRRMKFIDEFFKA